MLVSRNRKPKPRDSILASWNSSSVEFPVVTFEVEVETFNFLLSGSVISIFRVSCLVSCFRVNKNGSSLQSWPSPSANSSWRRSAWLTPRISAACCSWQHLQVTRIWFYDSPRRLLRRERTTLPSLRISSLEGKLYRWARWRHLLIAERFRVTFTVNGNRQIQADNFR